MIAEDTQTTSGPSVNEDPREARLSQLADDLASHDPVVRERARKALIGMGTAAAPKLIPLLTDHAPHVRWEAAKALCGIADPLSATALVNALDDPDDGVRWVAAEGLITLGREGLRPLLAALLERAKSLRLREGAHHVCHALARRRRRLKPILLPLLASFHHYAPEMAVPLAAYTALERLRECSEKPENHSVFSSFQYEVGAGLSPAVEVTGG